jgi:hypothetical protein
MNRRGTPLGVALPHGRTKRPELMKLIFREGKIEIWSVGHEFYVYGITLGGDPMVCPSIGMAWAMAAKPGDSALLTEK